MTTILLVFLVPLLVAAAEIDGAWHLNLIRFGEEFADAKVQLKVDGETLSGNLNELKLEGTFRNGQLNFTAKRPNGDLFGTFEGRAEGDELKGTLRGNDGEMGWVARRVTVPSGPPQTRTFEPVTFHRLFSDTIPPALHINPGDTVRTITVDAGGRDATGVRRSLGGNPETGPFYVEGAMPGDTLAVKFNRIRLNRDSANSGTRITPEALGAGYFRDAKFDDKFTGEWKLDREGGYAMLAKPSERLKNFRVKLQPMLGCVGVAPPSHMAFRTGWLGSWGGNMDYNGIHEGTTVYLPVYQKGAILFVGDGHAVQGDGELTGDALETSMDVEFTVGLISGLSTGGPRVESDEYLMAMGIAGSLNDALKIATTELARWLERDYKLTANEVAMVLGTSIRYDIAEVVDPQVNIVAKVSKSSLAQLPK
jgi:amidase